MAMIKWDPFGSISEIQERINKIFEEAFPKEKEEIDTGVGICSWKPAVDIYETDLSIILTIELPGVKKEDVSIEIRDNLLTITGERWNDKDIEDRRYYRRERCEGQFHRAFRLQDPVQPEMIKAKFKDGVLKIEIPKTNETKAKQIKINID